MCYGGAGEVVMVVLVVMMEMVGQWNTLPSTEDNRTLPKGIHNISFYI